jgi:hypothetical protein
MFGVKTVANAVIKKNILAITLHGFRPYRSARGVKITAPEVRQRILK